MVGKSSSSELKVQTQWLRDASGAAAEGNPTGPDSRSPSLSPPGQPRYLPHQLRFDKRFHSKGGKKVSY